MKLHKVALRAVAAFALAATATSASAGGRGSLKDDRPFSWSGFSIGVHAGYGFEGSGDRTTLTDGSSASSTHDSVASSTEGAFAGVSLGKDWQVGNVVYGIVVDISKSDFSGFFTPDVDDEFETKIDWFGTVRSKLGYATGPYLLYATAGLAYGSLKATQGDVHLSAHFDPVTGFVSKSESRLGGLLAVVYDVSRGKEPDLWLRISLRQSGRRNGDDDWSRW